ncbi:uncharacterized protein LOC135367388 [Ornithodoros turicata]|uniref:uncharacterized protein LOC135367388 n=1 Tax=Ornithodoros turicata TaxID=34597 RepID=UPI00313A0213
MKTVLTLLWLGCLLGLGHSTLTGPAFARKYRNLCFGEVRDGHVIKMGQRLPSGFTISSFLDKLEVLEEKLEENPKEKFKGAVQVAAYIIKTLYFNDYVFSGATIREFTPHSGPLRDIITKFLANIKTPDVDPAELLDEDDLCFLVLSLAHTVNTTLGQQPPSYTTNGDQPVDQQTLPREVGVVSVTNSLSDAVAIGRTLFGIASLHSGVQDKSVADIIDEPIKDAQSDANENKIIDAVTATTIGNMIASSFLEEEIEVDFGLSGIWNDSGCHVEYRLPRNVSMTATSAEILGAVDGYIIGKTLGVNGVQKEWKLSTLLRAYYSSSGLTTIPVGDVLTFCQRRALFQKYNNEQLQKPLGYMVLAAKYKFGVANPQEHLGKLRQALSKLDSKLSEASGYPGDVCGTTFREDEPKCDTPTDLFVVLDTNMNTVDNQQKRDLQSVLLETLLGQLNFQRNISNVRVFASKRHGRQELLEILPASGSSSCAGCVARYLNLRNLDINAVGADSVYDVLYSLNGTLRAYKESSRYENGVPSKVVLYINLEEQGSRNYRGSENQIASAANVLSNGHPDVKKYAVGYKDNLNALNNAFHIVDISSVGTGEQLSLESLRNNLELRNLYKSVCRDPAALQYEHCLPYGKRDEASAVFDGYVTPETVQYWSYSPWYFSASNYLQVKFSAGTNGHIKVCDVANKIQNDDRFTGLRCLETNNNVKTVIFNASSPCRSGSRACEPLKYAVIGKRQDRAVAQAHTGIVCEGLCRNQQQIKFLVNHEGMYCGGMLSAVFSPVTLLVTLIATLKSMS